MTYTLSKHFLISSIFVSVFLWASVTYASDPPNPISPSDNSTVDKSPKLTWEYSGECIESGSCFRVEVDNSPDFSSTEKESYTKSTSYTPQGLAAGSWNWRVKAKNKSGKWSDWSRVFHFTVSQTSDSSTAQSSSDSQKSQTSFSIKDIPSEINSDQDFESQVTLILPDNPKATFYLKAAFKKSDSSNYFGQTYKDNSWIKNNSSYSNQLKIETDDKGKWEGKIKVKPDQDDSGFKGSGDYVFKVARYTDSGNGPSWSNELTLKINEVNIPSPSEDAEVLATEIDPEETEATASTADYQAPRDYEIKIASVAGEATMSNNIPLEEQVQVLEDRKVNWLLIMLGIIVLLGGSGYVFYRVRKIKS